MLVNMHEAKTHFSRYVSKALAGEEVLIAKNGKPMVRLVPFTAPNGERTSGLSEGSVIVGDDFNNPLPQELLEELET